MMITLPWKAVGQTRTEEVYKTLTFCNAGTNSNKTQDYTSSWTETVSSFGWTICNFNNNNWGWTVPESNPVVYIVKCGRKKVNSTNTPSVATITTNAAIDQAITKVVVTLTAINRNDYNSIKLYMASTSAFDENNDDYFETITVNSIPTLAGDMTIIIPESKRAANRYYKVAFDTKGSTSSNGHTGVSKVVYYKEAAAPAYTITAQSNNTDLGTVSLAGTIITGAPAANCRYASPAYTVDPANSATVAQDNENINKFTVTPTANTTITINFEAIPTHTAHFSVNGTIDNNNNCTVAEGATITFPSNPADISGKKFMGWTTATISGTTNTAPTPLLTSATMGNSDITYYAVFAKVTAGSPVTDELTTSTFGSPSSYSDWSGKKATNGSDAVYAGNSTTYSSNVIQIRGSNSSGIITTTSGGKATKVTVTWNSYTSDDRTLDVYGKNTAYTNAADLYNDNNKGTLLGSLYHGVTINNVKTTTTELTISNDYQYIGLRSKSGAMYLDEIDIKWTPITYSNYCTTVAATHSVTYYRNYDENDTETSVIIFDEGDVVTVATNMFEASDCMIFSAWNSARDGDGTSYSAGAQLTENIQSDFNLYAQWRDIVYHVKFSVNGTIVSNRDVACNTEIGTLPDDPELAPLTFLGWSSTSPTGATNVNSSWKPTGENEDVTVYAVFGNIESDNLTINLTTSGITSTSYVSGSFTTNSISIAYSNVCKQTSGSDAFLQLKGSSGSVYNAANYSLGNITSIVINYYSGTDNYGLSVRGGNEKDPSTGTVITGSGDGDVKTFSFSDYSFGYFGIYCEGGYSRINSIVVYYEETSLVTVNIIDKNTNMSTDIAATTCVVVKDGATLNFTGDNKGNEYNLIIEDGGQLKLTNGTANVQATMKRNVAAWTGTVPDKGDEDNAGWYAIASPVNGLAISSFAQGIHNVYSYDEPTAYWHEYHSVLGESPAYNNLTSGVGYLYRSTIAGLEFKGALNAGDASGNVSPTLSFANSTNNDLKGFNLVGNPFSHNISWSDMTKKYIGEGYYLLDEDPESENHGKWGALTTGTIAPTQAFLVKAASASAELTINNNMPAPSKGEQANSDNILFSISNGSQSDETFVLFKEGYGLNKISHRNSEIPMLYVIDNGTNYAVATMPDNTQSFMLGFEAKTTGKYTLSFKANGEFNYLHVIDRMTGEDVDMLLEGEYSFIGSPMDNANRFIVRLGYLPNHDDNGEDIFAYQSGSDVVVSGEGELQIFDVMGRMISAQRINGVETINLSANGVYIFKLNEKTQKIVVR